MPRGRGPLTTSQDPQVVGKIFQNLFNTYTFTTFCTRSEMGKISIPTFCPFFNNCSVIYIIIIIKIYNNLHSNKAQKGGVCLCY